MVRTSSETYLDKLDKDARRLLDMTFPQYTGRKWKVVLADTISFGGTQWSGGSRKQYRIVKLDGMQVTEVETAPFLQKSAIHDNSRDLPAGYVVVEHSIFMGRDLGITFTVNPQEALKLIPVQDELPLHERIVLSATRSLKSSYAGISNYRQHEAVQVTGITTVEYENAKQTLIEKGMLNKAGAITAQGRNAIGWTELRELRMGTIQGN